MAARENQGYLIAVILLVLLSVILAISTYFGFTKMNEFADQRNSLQDRLNTEIKTSDAWQAQAGLLKSYLGVQGFTISETSVLQTQLASSGNQEIITETDSITQLYQQDMQRYNNKPEGMDGTWRGLIDDFADVVKSNHATLAIQNSKITTTEQEKSDAIKAKDAELAEKDKTLADVRAAKEEADTRHKEAMTEMQSKLDFAENENKRINQSLAASQLNETSAKNELASAKQRFEETKRNLESQIEELTRLETDVADGQIVSVSPILGKVVINVGYEDNLKLQQTFEIYDQDETHFKLGTGKAKIEVIRILDAHLAEARIIDQSPTVPILTRDFIVTTTWDPGYAVPIALAGFIDIDSDGSSDLQRMISIVNQAGGKVAAYHDEEGNVVGQIDENTRFFVRGEEPNTTAMASGYSTLDEQRGNYSVRTVTVREFLKSLGYNSEARIQRTGEAIKRRDFEERNPPSRSGDSAFGNN